MPADRNAELIELGDLDELVRHVDRLVDARAWEGLFDLHGRARRALERGKQLWPIASLAEYRLALEGPGEWAARVLTDEHGRFTLGPLPEVAASTHTWADLAPHLSPGPMSAMFAHERVLRGDDLSAVDVPGPPVLDVPLVLAPWEPSYAFATYKPFEVQTPSPDLPAPTSSTWGDTESPHPSDLLPSRDAGGDAGGGAVTEALRGLARTWVTESNGRVEVVEVEGTADDAVRRIVPVAVRAVELTAAQAVAAMAWTAASGGAHGRRRGAASGRFEAWWTLAALCGFDDDARPDADDLGEAASELRWFRWDAYEPVTGWELRLAIEDPADGLAWAIAATDAAL